MNHKNTTQRGKPAPRRAAPKAPPAPKVQTFTQATAWLRAHFTPDQLRAMGHHSAGDAVCWWWAHDVADVIADLSRRELVNLVIYGQPPLTVVACSRDMADEMDADTDHTASLCDFFEAELCEVDAALEFDHEQA